jgi:hypothetical protein
MTQALTINQFLASMPAPISSTMTDGPLELSLDELAMIYGGTFSGGEVAATFMAGAGVLVGAGVGLIAAPAFLGGALVMTGGYLIAAGVGVAVGTMVGVATR